jgi:dienelactone hydrolase
MVNKTKFFFLMSLAVGCAWASPQVACAPQERGSLELLPIRAHFSVTGRMGGFDPCEPNVRFRIPEGKKNASVIISVHGGGGISDVLRSDDEFYKNGFATLTFDAYSMQGLSGRTALFWARSVTNEARQRMIYMTTLAAYKWLIQRTDVDINNIYFFGISNGASVVANIAAVVDPKHVKGVVAEGITPIGLGLPDRINVPVLLAFGKLDNFGNSDPSGKRWTLSEDCRINTIFSEMARGSSYYCNRNSFPGSRIPTPLQWAESVKNSGGDVEIVYFEDMAHCAYCGSLNIQQATWSNGQTLDASVGATDAARKNFMSSMIDFVSRHK